MTRFVNAQRRHKHPVTGEFEDGETYDLATMMENKHDVKNNPSGGWNVEIISMECGDASKIIEKLSFSELRGKEKNMHGWKEGLSDIEKGNSERDTVWFLGKEAVMEEDTDGW
ncbi:hypothetical protein Taro_036668, partial [Colocasia esculenta]|nr:hypothetical protein [Colocasia esculenta]